MFEHSFLRKEEKAYLKKRSTQIVSVFLAVLMVLSSFVWAPEMFPKAEAAGNTAGTYSGTVTFDWKNGNILHKGYIYQIVLYHKANNGTATSTNSTPNLLTSTIECGKNKDGSGSGSFSGTGFPIYVSLQLKCDGDGCDEAKIQISNIQVNINGVNGSTSSYSLGSFDYENQSTGWKNSSSIASSAYPKASRISWSSQEVSFDVPSDPGVSITKPIADVPHVYDQYGVEMASDIDGVGNKLSYSVYTSENGTATLSGATASRNTSTYKADVSVSNSVKDWVVGSNINEPAESRTCYVKANLSGNTTAGYSDAIPVTLNNYMVKVNYELNAKDPKNSNALLEPGPNGQVYWGTEDDPQSDKVLSEEVCYGFPPQEIPANAYRLGYKFEGIYDAPGSPNGNTVPSSGKVTKELTRPRASGTAPTVTYYARWTPIDNKFEYFNSDGQSVLKTTQKYDKTIEDIPAPSNPSYPGKTSAVDTSKYVFNKWLIWDWPEHSERNGTYLDTWTGANYLDAPDSNTTVKFIATYKFSETPTVKQYDVTFHDASGAVLQKATGAYWSDSGLAAVSGNDKLIQGKTGTTVTEANGFDLTGYDYTLEGWTLTEPSNGKWAAAYDEVDEDGKIVSTGIVPDYLPTDTYRLKEQGVNLYPCYSRAIKQCNLGRLYYHVVDGNPENFVDKIERNEDTTLYKDYDFGFPESPLDYEFNFRIGGVMKTLTFIGWNVIEKSDFDDEVGIVFADTAEIPYTQGHAYHTLTTDTYVAAVYKVSDVKYSATFYNGSAQVGYQDDIPSVDGDSNPITYFVEDQYNECKFDPDEENPSKVRAGQTGYKFVGWTEDPEKVLNPAAEDLVTSYTITDQSRRFYAAYDSFTYYKVTFKDDGENGNILGTYDSYYKYSEDDKNCTIEYTDTAPETDTFKYIPIVEDRISGIKYQYTFMGWKSSVESENTKYSFVDEDGNTVGYAVAKCTWDDAKGETVKVGESITVTADRTYTAVYKKDTRKYNISLYGIDVDPEAVKLNDAGYSMYTCEAEGFEGSYYVKNEKIYTLSGDVYTEWDPSAHGATFEEAMDALTPVHEAPIAVLNLKYGTNILNEVKKLYYGDSDPVLDGSVEANSAEEKALIKTTKKILDPRSGNFTVLKVLPYKETEEKEIPYETDQYKYSFNGWSPAINANATVVGDASYSASYRTDNVLYTAEWFVPNAYTATTKDDVAVVATSGYKLHHEATYRYNRALSVPPVTPKASDITEPIAGGVPNYVWTFLGWYECSVPVDGDGNFTFFDAEGKVIVDENKVIKTQGGAVAEFVGTDVKFEKGVTANPGDNHNRYFFYVAKFGYVPIDYKINVYTEDKDEASGYKLLKSVFGAYEGANGEDIDVYIDNSIRKEDADKHYFFNGYAFAPNATGTAACLVADNNVDKTAYVIKNIVAEAGEENIKTDAKGIKYIDVYPVFTGEAHNKETVVRAVNPTYMAEGSNNLFCSVCQYAMGSEKVPMLVDTAETSPVGKVSLKTYFWDKDNVPSSEAPSSPDVAYIRSDALITVMAADTGLDENGEPAYPAGLGVKSIAFKWFKENGSEYAVQPETIIYEPCEKSFVNVDIQLPKDFTEGSYLNVKVVGYALSDEPDKVYDSADDYSETEAYEITTGKLYVDGLKPDLVVIKSCGSFILAANDEHLNRVDIVCDDEIFTAYTVLTGPFEEDSPVYAYKDYDVIYQINGGGKYSVTAVDNAGNQNRQVFEIYDGHSYTDGVATTEPKCAVEKKDESGTVVRDEKGKIVYEYWDGVSCTDKDIEKYFGVLTQTCAYCRQTKTSYIVPDHTWNTNVDTTKNITKDDVVYVPYYYRTVTLNTSGTGDKYIIENVDILKSDDKFYKETQLTDDPDTVEDESLTTVLKEFKPSDGTVVLPTHTVDIYTIDEARTCLDWGSKSVHCTTCECKDKIVKIEKQAEDQSDEAYAAYVAAKVEEYEGKGIDLENIRPYGHDDAVRRTTKKATCTEDGIVTYSCRRCTWTKKETVPKLGHTLETDNPKYNYLSKSVLEGDSGYFKRITAVDGKDVDDFDPNEYEDTYKGWIMGKLPTCTKTGNMYRLCATCKKRLVTLTIKETGHVEENVTPKGNYCWAYPKIEEHPEGDSSLAPVTYVVWKCKVCGEEREVNPELKSHDFTVDNRVLYKVIPATCAEPEIYIYKCASPACNVTQIARLDDAGQPLDKQKDHNWILTDDSNKPTCEVAGKEIYTCYNYFKSKTDETVTISVSEYLALSDELKKGYEGVAFDKVIGWSNQPDTAKRTKQSDYQTDTYKYPVYAVGTPETKEVKIPARGHSWDNGKVEKEPTCAENGVRKFTCTTVLEYKSKTDESVTITVEQYKKLTDEAEKEKYEAVLCAAEKRELIDRNDGGHIFERDADNKIVYNSIVKTPTCTEKGLGFVTCKGECGAAFYIDIEPAGHEKSNGVHKDATCVEPAGTEYTCNRVIAYTDGENEISIDEYNALEDKTAYTEVLCEEKFFVADEDSEPLGHNFTYSEEELAEIAVIVTEPTCVLDGLMTVKCRNCDETEERAIPALDHDFSVLLEEGECEDAEGHKYALKKCSRCDEENVEFFELKEHSFGEAKLNEVPATCEANAKYDLKCTVCEKVVTFEEEGTMLPHTAGEAVKEKEVPVTCLTAGYYESVVYCKFCPAELSREEITVDPLGHDFDESIEANVTELPASCTEAGYTRIKCSRCDEYSEEIIPATGHTPVIDEEKSVKLTCTVNGETYYKCSVCFVALDEMTEIVEAEGHNFEYTDAEIAALTPETPATCLENGLVKLPCKNAGCTDSMSFELPALGHDWQNIAAPEDAPEGQKENKEATCYEDGLQWVECANCHNKEAQVLPKTENHNTVETVVPATCTDNKRVEITCAVEGCPFKETLVEMRATSLGHLWETEIDEETGVEVNKYTVDVPATCTKDGIMSIHCVECDERKDAVAIPATGHKFEKLVEKVEATCSEQGKIIYECINENCGFKGYRKATDTDETLDLKQEMTGEYTVKVMGKAATTEDVIPVDSTKHVWGEGVETKKASCTEKGVMTYSCTVDGCEEKKTEEIPMTDHVADTTVIRSHSDATCKDYEVTVYKCKNCENDVTVTGTTLGEHTKGALVITYTEPTCADKGRGLYNCEICKSTFEADIDATGNHDYKENIVKAATCTEAGEKNLKCSVCNTVKADSTEVIPVKTHDYVENIITAATCTEPGEKNLKCSVCKAVKPGSTETIDPLGHDIVTEEAVKATCTKNGLTEGKHCSRCDYVEVEQTTVTATGHKKGAVVKVEYASCVKEGTEVYICSECSESVEVTLPIDPDAHKFGGWTDYFYAKESDKPTCTENGLLTRTNTCVNKGCTEVRTDTKVETALGHDLVETGRSEPTYASGKIVTVVSYKCSRCDHTEDISVPNDAWKVTVKVEGRADTSIILVDGQKLTKAELDKKYTPNVDDENDTHEEVEWLVNGEAIKLPYDVNSDITVTAKITVIQNKYVIKFTNKSGRVFDTKEYVKGEKVVVPANLVLGDIYEFKGWIDDTEERNHYTPDAIPNVTASVTYSPWFEIKSSDPEYYVTFRNETGTRILFVDTVIENQRVGRPETNPEKSSNSVYHYNFKNWVTEAGNASAVFNFNKGVTKNITLYAYFEVEKHDTDKSVVIQSVSCTQNEISKITCSCGLVREEVTKGAYGHNYQLSDVSDDGLLLTYKCTRCGDEWTKTKTTGGELEDAIVIIVKDNNGAPLKGATVTVYVSGTSTVKAKTDANGKAYFEKYDETTNPNGLKDGTYSTKISGDGFNDATGKIRVSNGTGSQKVGMTKPTCHCVCHAGNFFSKIKKFFSNFIRLFNKDYRCCPCEEGL